MGDGLLFPYITIAFMVSIMDVVIESTISIMYTVIMISYLKEYLFVSFIMTFISWILQFIIFCYIFVEDSCGEKLVNEVTLNSIVRLWLNTIPLGVITIFIEVKLEPLYLWCMHKCHLVSNKIAGWWNQYSLMEDDSTRETEIEMV
jgi:hypothetical protein